MSAYYDLNGPIRQTVLVVDDSPAILTIFGHLLAPWYNVRVADSGKRALEVVHTAPTPDIILLDVLMPDMDGHAVLKALRDDPEYRSIPVMFVSSLDESENEEIGLAEGAVDFIQKPIKPGLLLARINTYLTLRAERNALVHEIAFLHGEIARMASENEKLREGARESLTTPPGVLASEIQDHNTEPPEDHGEARHAHSLLARIRTYLAAKAERHALGHDSAFLHSEIGRMPPHSETPHEGNRPDPLAHPGEAHSTNTLTVGAAAETGLVHEAAPSFEHFPLSNER